MTTPDGTQPAAPGAMGEGISPRKAESMSDFERICAAYWDGAYADLGDGATPWSMVPQLPKNRARAGMAAALREMQRMDLPSYTDHALDELLSQAEQEPPPSSEEG